LYTALVRLEAPQLTDILSDTTVAIQLFPLTSSTDHHVNHYYIAVVPANVRTPSNEVRLDEVRTSYQHGDATVSEFLVNLQCTIL